eukprot:scaffold269898_cov22-Prasinocladus_malaysianus.AAC.1
MLFVLLPLTCMAPTRTGTSYEWLRTTSDLLGTRTKYKYEWQLATNEALRVVKMNRKTSDINTTIETDPLPLVSDVSQ